MNWFLILLLLIYGAIPLWILLQVFQVENKRIRKNRIKYAIPSLILTIINITALGYYFCFKHIPFIRWDDNTYLIPGLALLLVIIIWNSGKKQEKFIQMDITGEEIERIRFKKGDSNRHSLTISSEDEDEML